MTILNFIKNGGNLSKTIENTVGKGEIAHYSQFLLFPQCFQKTCTACRHVKTRALLGEGYCHLQFVSIWTSRKFNRLLTPYHTIPTFNDPETEGF